MLIEVNFNFCDWKYWRHSREETYDLPCVPAVGSEVWWSDAGELIEGDDMTEYAIVREVDWFLNGGEIAVNVTCEMNWQSDRQSEQRPN